MIGINIIVTGVLSRKPLRRDVIIRIMDVARAKNYRVAEALIAKIKYNEGREIKHGGKKF